MCVNVCVCVCVNLSARLQQSEATAQPLLTGSTQVRRSFFSDRAVAGNVFLGMSAEIKLNSLLESMARPIALKGGELVVGGI